jgi:formylglycine-generating enzyme required for sulfatase activity
MTRNLIEIPAGAFTMGSDSIPDASPQHRLSLAAFHIGKYPVTNAEYREFVDANGYLSREWWTEMGWRWLQSRPQPVPGFWDDPRFNDDMQPVVGVSWYEAVAYCRWQSATTARSFRLPTEAEWEKAARGASDARRFHGVTGSSQDARTLARRALAAPHALMPIRAARVRTACSILPATYSSGR